MREEQGEGGRGAKVYLCEDNTGVIAKSSLRVQFDYNFTDGDKEEGLNYTQHWILFPNGTRLIRQNSE
jgi:hypothetical protein